MEILNRIVNVKNRGVGEVGYTLPDTGVRRTWAPGEIKKSIRTSYLYPRWTKTNAKVFSN